MHAIKIMLLKAIKQRKLAQLLAIKQKLLTTISLKTKSQCKSSYRLQALAISHKQTGYFSAIHWNFIASIIAKSYSYAFSIELLV